MKLLKYFLIFSLLGVVSVVGFVHSGIFNVAATVEDNPITKWLLHTTMENSVERRAKDIDIPDLNNKEMILAGLSDYSAMCGQCHGEPGEPPSVIRQGLNPAPPEFKHLATAVDAAEMFWIIRNGIRMTGMPAFGKTHDVNEIWPVVAFLQSGVITPEEYNHLKTAAEGHGHHHEHNHSH